MKIFMTFGFCIFSSIAFAQGEPGSRTWYVVQAYKCHFSNQTTVAYDQNQDMNKVTATLAGASKTFYPGQTVYFPDLNLSKIDFDGHKPSAGPVLDTWETDYSMQFDGAIPVGTKASITGKVYRNTAFTGWVKTGDSVTCDIFITSTF